MSEPIRWTYAPPRTRAARQAWHEALPLWRRTLFLSLLITTLICLGASAISTRLPLPLAGFAAVAGGVPCLLLLMPLAAFVLPEQRYQLDASGLSINGKRLPWRHVVAFTHGRQPHTLLIAQSTGETLEVHLPAPPLADSVMNGFRQWSPVAARPTFKVLRFSPGEVSVLLVAVTGNALLASLLFSLFRTQVQPHLLGWLGLAALPAALFAAGMARLWHPGFTRLPLPMAIIGFCLCSALTQIYVLAFFVRT